jgi:hypothetical protein
MFKTLLFMIYLIFNASYAIENVCDGPEIMNLIDRPTFAKGACVMPEKKSMIEYGATHYKFINEGEANGIGEIEYRFGLVEHTEIYISPPTYYQQSIHPKAGFGYTTISLKHLVYQDTQRAFTLDAGVIPSGGSYYFGSRNIHGYGNVIAYMNLNNQISNAVVFGYANYGEYNETDFENFSTFLLDYALSYSPNDHSTIYGELTSQTKSNYSSGFGLIFSTGLIYKLNNFATIDIEFTQRIIGELNYSTNAIGIGGAVKFF